jgi:hypothetical protein
MCQYSEILYDCGHTQRREFDFCNDVESCTPKKMEVWVLNYICDECQAGVDAIVAESLAVYLAEMNVTEGD